MSAARHRRALGALGALMLGACGGGEEVNPPTEPADPIEAPEVEGLPTAGQGAVYLPGTGPASFIGAWAEDVSWCDRPATAAQSPIRIDIARFEGYGAGCDLAEIVQTGDSYDARLRCVRPQGVVEERIRMSVVGDVMTLIHFDRDGRRVTLNKCTTLADTNPEEPMSLGDVLGGD